MTTRKWHPAVSAVLALLLTVTACAPRKGLKKGAGDTASAGDKDVGPAVAPSMETGEANIRGSEFISTSDLKTVYFDYDAYSLSEDSRSALQKNAQYLKENPELDVLVAGFCDERGTIEYNLALGQKRAKEVREYLVRLGIPAKAIATLSYGKESQSCAESTESCWRENRRAETRIRSRSASNGHGAIDPKAPQ